MNDDEKFFAWLDGELASTEAAEMEAKVAADPELRRLAEQHRALGAQMRNAFDPIAAAPVPERLKAALRPQAQVIDFAAAKRARSMPALAQWTAMAATLAVGMDPNLASLVGSTMAGEPFDAATEKAAKAKGWK